MYMNKFTGIHTTQAKGFSLRHHSSLFARLDKQATLWSLAAALKGQTP